MRILSRRSDARHTTSELHGSLAVDRFPPDVPQKGMVSSFILHGGQFGGTRQDEIGHSYVIVISTVL